jgi:hypothetical protein
VRLTRQWRSFYLKRAKKLLSYIDIGEANKVMASAIKTKKTREEGND